MAQDRTNHVIASLTGAVEVVVAWTGQFLYAVSAGPGGSVAGTPGGWYDAGTLISNQAVAEAHRHFAGWTGAPAGRENDNPLVFALDDASTNLMAHFGTNTAALAAAGPDEQGRPALAFSVAPPELAVAVQRTESLGPVDDWQTITTLPPGATNWTDELPPDGWQTLFYRLAE